MVQLEEKNENLKFNQVDDFSHIDKLPQYNVDICKDKSD